MNAQLKERSFIRMHGLGNRFVVFDARAGDTGPDAAQARQLARQEKCDQILTILPSSKADAFMRIQNADGGEVDACGNGVRCVARYLMDERGLSSVVIETNAGRLPCRLHPDGERVQVDMGRPRLEWEAIPLSQDPATLDGPFACGPLSDPVFVNVGNPHAVFFVDDAEAIDLETWGPEIENAPLFPQRINVEAVSKVGDDMVRMRVWERGVGITSACGTGACATAVAAIERGLAGDVLTVRLDGGDLVIERNKAGHIIMTGDAVIEERGSTTL